MNDVDYEVHVLKIVRYHGTVQMKVPGDNISPDWEEGYARGQLEGLISSGNFDEKVAEWDELFDIEYEVVAANPTVIPPLSGSSPPVDSEVIPVEEGKWGADRD